MCFTFIYYVLLKHFSFYEDFSDISQTYTGTRLKYQLLTLEFNATWNLLDMFPKNAQIYNFYKIRPVATELFRVDGQTDTHDEA
jgi:hypothetical protein